MMTHVSYMSELMTKPVSIYFDYVEHKRRLSVFFFMQCCFRPH